MFSVLHRTVGIVFAFSKAIISDFWTQSTLTHTAMNELINDEGVCRAAPGFAQPYILETSYLQKCNLSNYIYRSRQKRDLYNQEDLK